MPAPNRGGQSRIPPRPDWLKDWIADQPQYMTLTCGHKDRVNVRGVIIIETIFDGVQMYCDRCQTFAIVNRKISLREYFGLPAVETTDVPLF